MSFRWDSFLNKTIPAAEQFIGGKIVKNRFKDALDKMVSGYEEIANKNSEIINGPNPDAPNPDGTYNKTPVDEKGQPIKPTNPLLKFYQTSQEEIGKLQANPYDKGNYSGKLSDMYTKLTTKEKVDSPYSLEFDKFGNGWKFNKITGKSEQVSKAEIEKEWSPYEWTVDDGQGGFVTKQGFVNKKDPNEVIEKGSFMTPKELEKSSNRSSRGPGSRKKKDEIPPKDYKFDPGKGTPESWSWENPNDKAGKKYTLGKVAQSVIPQNIGNQFDSASKKSPEEVNKLYNYYMDYYEKQGYGDEDLQDITNLMDQLYDLYYPKTSEQAGKK